MPFSLGAFKDSIVLIILVIPSSAGIFNRLDYLNQKLHE